MSRLRIWTDYKPLGPDAAMLRARLEGYDIIVRTGEDTGLSQADIAFGQPDPQQAIDLPNLRWIHLNTAGYTRYDRDDIRKALRARGAVLTNSSGVYSQPCAEHVLAMIMTQARKLPQSFENQRSTRAWPANQLRASSVLMENQHVLLVGFGSIAHCLVELLAPLRVQITGVRRTVKGDEPIKMVKVDQLDEVLGWADHVVNLLPASPSTTRIFTTSRFEKMKRSAIFYNIGRGDTVDQEALRAALETRIISGAYIDVMTPEPLPPNDPLWTAPNCYITPHTAGGHTDEIERNIEHFVGNLRRFEIGEPMRDRVI